MRPITPATLEEWRQAVRWANAFTSQMTRPPHDPEWWSVWTAVVHLGSPPGSEPPPRRLAASRPVPGGSEGVRQVSEFSRRLKEDPDRLVRNWEGHGEREGVGRLPPLRLTRMASCWSS